MTRYRIDVFDKAFNLISYAAVSEKTIRVDYLVNDASMLMIPQIVEAYVNNYIAVRQNGVIYLSGIISDVVYDHGQTTISFISFMSLLDVEVQVNPTVFNSTPAEQWLRTKLLELYAGSDTYQNLTGFSCSYTSSTIIPMEYELDSDGKVELSSLNLFSFAQDLLTKHDIIVKWAVDFANKTIHADIGKINNSDVWTIKLGLADTPEYTIDIHSIEGDFNKIKYFNEANFSNTVTYYLHTDGTVSTNATTGRLTPVKYIEKTAKADTTAGATKTFEQVALIDAQSTMLNTNFDHEIIVTFNTDSKILSMGEIGQVYRLITPDGVTYNSILTGYEQINAKFLRLVFGYVRTNLTTILKMQRRKR